jgi:stage II sporulation protein P
MKKEKNKQKNKRRLKFLLFLHIVLFFIWAAAVAYLTWAEKGKEPASLMDKPEVQQEADTKTRAAAPKNSDGQAADSVEVAPSPDILAQEPALIDKEIVLTFPEIESPKLMDRKHSTFGKKVVYIYHTHNRESFLPYLRNAEQPEEAFHSKVNVSFVGKMLDKALEQQGIGTVSDSADIVGILEERGIHYGEAYDVSREHVNEAKRKYRDLDIFLDIHRDSLRKEATTVEVNGDSFAKLLFVVGTGHSQYEKNYSFASRIHETLQAHYPGLSKGVLLKDSQNGNGVYNQDVSPNAIIVETGGVDNTAEELQRTVQALAAVLSDVYWHGNK